MIATRCLESSYIEELMELQPQTTPVETLYQNTYFFHSPRQKCLLSQIKRLFSPSFITMLFAVTQEMHA